MTTLPANLKFLRKQKDLTQTDLANKLGVNRSVIGAYEEGRAEPKLKTLISMAHFFKVSLDDLLSKRLETAKAGTYDLNIKDNLRILPVSIDRSEGKELIPLVPQRASAGYLSNYGDMEFIEQLPQFEMPFPEMTQDRTYRIFQTEGDSMLPVPSGSYVICQFVDDWKTVKDGQCCVFVTLDEGVVYKRVVNEVQENNRFVLKSDNPEYDPFDVPVDQVTEIWKALGYVTFSLPEGFASFDGLGKLTSMVNEIHNDVKELKAR
ncbi:helix-turn-helix domain-containing protein [Halocola ammonii]